MSALVRIDEEGPGIAVLTMDDGEGRNVFSDRFIERFLEALDELERHVRPKVLILRGRPDVFCGGAEKQALLDLCDGKVTVVDLVLSERLVAAPFPVVAAVEGHAVGGGLVLALCSDMVVAARESRYGAVFMNLGFTPGMGATVLLQELVGPFTANEMMFTGKRFRGSELEGRGTHFNYILPRERVFPKARDIALQIGEKQLESVYLLKFALSARKKKLLVDARLQEELMHRVSFRFPETRQTINELYPD